MLLAAVICLSALFGCDNRGGGDTPPPFTPPSSTLVTVAKELADEVDTLTTVEALLSYGTAAKPRISEMSLEVHYPGEEQRGDNVNFYATFDAANDIIARMKQMKNEALSVCTQLNTWVKAAEGPYSAAYRLNYDPTLNLVTVEHRTHKSDVNSYRMIRVTYDAEGRLKIDSYNAQFSEAEIASEEEIHYLEDVYFASVDKRVLFGSGRLTYIDLEREIWSYLTLTGSISYDPEGNVTNITYNPMSPSYHYKDGDFFISVDTDSCDVYNAEGKHIFFYDHGGSEVLMSLNDFSGWSRFEIDRETETLTLYTDKGSFECRSFFTYKSTEFGFSYWIASDSTVYFRPHERADVSATLEGLFSRLGSDMGLVLKDSAPHGRVIAAMNGYSDIAGSMNYVGGITGADMDIDTYFLVIDMLTDVEHTVETLNAIYDDEAISASAQNALYEYFEFLKIDFSGRASVDTEAGKIALDSVRVSVEPSLLLKDGAEYSLVFAFAGTERHLRVCEIRLTYTGEALVYTGEGSVIDIAAAPTEYGEYVLVCYLALSDGGRISEAVTVASENTAALTTELDTCVSYFSADGEKITVVNEVVLAEEE